MPGMPDYQSSPGPIYVECLESTLELMQISKVKLLLRTIPILIKFLSQHIIVFFIFLNFFHFIFLNFFLLLI